VLQNSIIIIIIIRIIIIIIIIIINLNNNETADPHLEKFDRRAGLADICRKFGGTSHKSVP
jgi:hypothetical protein